jgi:TetR/AcrR family transcriptional regulator, mexJK operon transcriptional repressor
MNYTVQFILGKMAQARRTSDCYGAAKKQRGRVVTEVRVTGKRQDIIEAATRVFLADGYGSASMDAIADAARVSKVTVYNHFGSKEALFVAVVNAVSDTLTAPLGMPEADDGPPETTLRRIGRQLVELLLSPLALSLYRVVVAETPKQPELGALFYNSGPGRSAAALGTWLERPAAAGVLSVPEPRRAAEQFLGMVCGHLHLRRLFDAQDTLDEAEIAAHVEAAVSCFLARYGGAVDPPRR